MVIIESLGISTFGFSLQMKTKFTEALEELHFEDDGIQLILEKDFTQPQLFYFGTPPERTDFMTFIAGIKFEEAYTFAIDGQIDSIDLKVIQIHHLIQNKKAAGRLKDLADIEQLELILKQRES